MNSDISNGAATKLPKVAQWMPGLVIAATRLPKVMDLGPRNLAATQGVAT